MTNFEKQLIADLRISKIGLTEFEEKFPVNIYHDNEYVKAQIDSAIAAQDEVELGLAIYLMWLPGQYWDNWHPDVNILNKLLITPFHTAHQEIAMAVQKSKDSSSIPFIRKVLESNFDYLSYTCSDSGATAKWFSWGLAEINTKEAWDVIKEFSHSNDEGIRLEMLYRLKKFRAYKE